MGFMVGFRSFFKTGWRCSRRCVDEAAVAKTTSARKLRVMASRSKDERVRLAAARRLNDGRLIRRLALTATQDAVRLDAAIDVQNQSSLTAIALKAWDIHLGQKAVRHICSPLLLRRVASSAQQDAIRLEAALKLQDRTLLRRVARSSNHIDVRWQIAHYLKDPCMLADIAMFKPGNIHLEPLRRMARRALINQLDRCRQANDHGQLLEVIKSSVCPAFKLEAFVRLPAGRITRPVLEEIAGLDLRYIPAELRDDMINHIGAGGWQVKVTVEHSECNFCRGSGQLSLKCVTANDTWSDCDGLACPDCLGSGKIPFRQAVCAQPGNIPVAIMLPI